MTDREYLCDAGDCETRSGKLPILVIVGGSRERFCSYQHLAEWAAMRARREEPIPSAYR